MLLQFTVVEDNSIWITDTQFLQWGRVSAPQSDPESKVLESGKLVPKGFGVYGLDPRTEGLRTIGTYVVGLGQQVKIYLRANVPIKDFTMPVPIRQVLYEILPSDPKQMEHSIQEMQDEKPALPEVSSESEQPTVAD
jgi:hypothetical protein